MMFKRKRKNIIIFVVGCFCGIYLENILKKYVDRKFYSNQEDKSNTWHLVPEKHNIKNGALYFTGKNLYDKNSEASDYFHSIPILCWVLTTKDTLHTKAQAVKDTWGQRCQVLLFFSSEDAPSFPAISLDVKEGYMNLHEKVKAAWRYIFKHHSKDASWFIKADDDTFLIMENLRYFLSSYSSSDKLFFGRNLWHHSTDYNSGGAGYVFSRQTLIEYFSISKTCESKSNAEDVAVAACLKKVGITPSDTRDDDGRETFHPFAPDFHLVPGSIGKDNWLYQRSRWELVEGVGCCSKYSIAFHYTTTKRMYLLNYYLYVLKKGF